jgi:translation initiation factor IF-1
MRRYKMKIKICRLPGKMQEVVLSEDDKTISAAIKAAKISFEWPGFGGVEVVAPIRKKATLETELEEGDVVLVLGKIHGD